MPNDPPKYVPNDHNPRYDNYGKGSWNRYREDEDDYREKLGRIKYPKEQFVGKLKKKSPTKTTYTYG